MNIPTLLLQIQNIYNISNSTGSVQSLVQTAQSMAPVSETMTMAIGLVAFLSLKETMETSRAAFGALFIASFTSFVFYSIGVMNQIWVTALMILLAGSVLAIFMDKRI